MHEERSSPMPSLANLDAIVHVICQHTTGIQDGLQKVKTGLHFQQARSTPNETAEANINALRSEELGGACVCLFDMALTDLLFIFLVLLMIGLFVSSASIAR